MIKSQSWTGCLNKGRLSTAQTPSPTNQPNIETGTQPVLNKRSIAATGNASAKSSPGHTALDPRSSEILRANALTAGRRRDVRSDYDIVSITRGSERARSKSPKPKHRHPNDPLIDLGVGNKFSGSGKNLPATKVSILEAFDPLAGGADVNITGANRSKYSCEVLSDDKEVGVPIDSGRDDVPDNNLDDDG